MRDFKAHIVREGRGPQLSKRFGSEWKLVAPCPGCGRPCETKLQDQPCYPTHDSEDEVTMMCWPCHNEAIHFGDDNYDEGAFGVKIRVKVDIEILE